MIWALLVILGIPIWLIVGALVGVFVSRRRFKRQPGVFTVSVRAADRKKWPLQPAYGRLVRDVLVLNRGVALLRTEFHAVVTVEHLDIGGGPRRPVGAVGRSVTVVDGPRLELALDPTSAARLDELIAGAQRPAPASDPD